ncbi:SDR family NAD(P)-dependent oxidoreductase [Streptomyces sp. Ag109_O5-1]|uniref:SDR family NAD(P)-dependent oxidoreductase n=1 Tax=Streptomyces sp. Ag109_O5-1 TaxID=1938851 RepID=UPI0037DA0271
MTTKNRSLALVTGASSGIGKETALALVAAGFDVAGTSRVAAENPVLAQRAAVVERLGEREDLGADGARSGRVRAENPFEQGARLSAVPMREAAGLPRDRTPHGWPGPAGRRGGTSSRLSGGRSCPRLASRRGGVGVDAAADQVRSRLRLLVRPRQRSSRPPGRTRPSAFARHSGKGRRRQVSRTRAREAS